jgi:ParB/RepB/Spo0J family partition protein
LPTENLNLGKETVMKKFTFQLKEIEVARIEPNPNNPRGDNVRDNDDQFDYLLKSIDQFGLIVPLIVQRIPGDSERYRLLDGERRYLALKELGIKVAPANVITDQIDENEAKNVMFHIHTNRVDWNACEQCKALEPSYELLKKKWGENENEIAKEIVRLTGTRQRTISDRLNFLRWPEKIKKDVYSKHPALYWTIAEIESGIVAPALKNFPEYFKKVKVDEVREMLLKKFLQGSVHAATEVRKARSIVRTTKEQGKQYKYASEILKNLVEKVNYTFDEAKEDFLSKYPDAEDNVKTSYKKLVNHISRVTTILHDFDFSFLSVVTKQQISEVNSLLDELEQAVNDFKKETRKSSE